MCASQAVAAGRPPRGSIYHHRDIDPVELPAIMRKHIYTGMMGVTYYALVGGLFFIAFWNELGLGASAWSFMVGLAQFAVVGQLLSAFLTRRTGQRKKLWYFAEGLSRVCRLAGLAGAYWLAPIVPIWATVLLVALIVMAGLCQSLGQPPWLSWLASIVPANRHGWFMGRRTMWIALATAAVSIPCGWLISRFPVGERAPVLAGIFAVAFAIGFIDLLIHRTIPEPAIATDRKAHPFRELLVPLRDPRFRPFLIFRAAWMFSLMIGGAVTLPYWMENLGIAHNFLTSTLLIIGLPLVICTLTIKKIGELVDRIGTRRVLWWGHVFWCCVPLLWLVATPQTVFIVLAVWAVINSLGTRASMLATGKIQTRSAPPDQSATYIAASSVTTALAAGLGALFGGLILHLAPPIQWSLGFKSCGIYELIFLTSLAGRAVSLLLIRRLQEPAMAEPVAKELPPSAEPEPPVRRGVA